MANNDGPNSSSSTSSSSSSSENPRKALEEVWKDINLSNVPSTPTLTLDTRHQSFDNTITKPTTTSTSFRGIILQDFLSGSFIRGSSALDELTPFSPAPIFTALKLNSGHLLNACLNPNVRQDGDDRAACITPKKRQQMSEGFAKGNCNVLEQRKKRMIKNRESAARSRARKQAYTNELELEVANLISENKKLKRMNEELRMAMAAETNIVPRKLQRSTSAPF